MSAAARPKKRRAGAAFDKAAEVAQTPTPPDTPPVGEQAVPPAVAPGVEGGRQPVASDPSEAAGLYVVGEAAGVMAGAPAPDRVEPSGPPLPEALVPAQGHPAVPGMSGAQVSAPAQQPASAAADASLRDRTNDAVPVKIAQRVKRDKRDAATVIALAVTKAYTDGVLPELAAAYRNRGQVETLFGQHRPAKPDRAGPTVRQNYNPTYAEIRGYEGLAKQLDISRAVLVSLALAYFYGYDDPAAIV